MKIATWNINSVRLRIQLVTKFLKEHDIDVLCLQETKTQDEHFPDETIAEAGWPHIAIRGEKSYNGVAILSRLPLTYISHLNWTGRTDCRHISAVVNGLTLHNFYVPAGGDEPDIDKNPKFNHKLKYLPKSKSWSTNLNIVSLVRKEAEKARIIELPKLSEDLIDLTLHSGTQSPLLINDKALSIGMMGQVPKALEILEKLKREIKNPQIQKKKQRLCSKECLNTIA